ncbi:MAG: hypothetical protein JWP82_2904 [Humibacillus sp.]|nr:hypothetical protein [Humibacillus sp.]
MSLGGRLRWALAAVVLGALFLLEGWVTLRTGTGTRLDTDVASAVLNGIDERIRLDLSTLARPVIIVALAPVVALLVIHCLVRRSWRRALAGVLVPLGSTVLALLLRAEDLFRTGEAAFPSNHAAVALSLLAATLLTWPARVNRWGLFVGGVAALSIGLGNVSWYAHQPRDVVGSALLVGCVTAAVVAVLGGDTANLSDAVAPRLGQRTEVHTRA